MAWKGPLPEFPGIDVRVEAATARAFAGAVVLLGLIFALAVVSQGGPAAWITGVLGFFQIAAVLWILVRFGLLAGVAATLTGQIGNAFPPPAIDPGAWHAAYGAAGIAVIAAGAAFGAALASRRGGPGAPFDLGHASEAKPEL